MLADRIIPEWKDLDAEARQFTESVAADIKAAVVAGDNKNRGQAESSGQRAAEDRSSVSPGSRGQRHEEL